MIFFSQSLNKISGNYSGRPDGDYRLTRRSILGSPVISIGSLGERYCFARWSVACDSTKIGFSAQALDFTASLIEDLNIRTLKDKKGNSYPPLIVCAELAQFKGFELEPVI